jgi:hypothetical protein
MSYFPERRPFFSQADAVEVMHVTTRYDRDIQRSRSKFCQLYFNFGVRKAKAAGKFEDMRSRFQEVKAMGIAVALEAKRFPRARKNKAAFEMVISKIHDLLDDAYEKTYA